MSVDLRLYHSEGIMPMEWTEMAVNSEILIKTLTFVSIGMISVQWWLPSWWWPGLLVFISTTLQSCIIIQIAYVHVWSAEKQNLTSWVLAMAMQCLHLNHCREMGMIFKAELSISALWLQVVMSVSRCTLLHNVWPLVVWFNAIVIRMLSNWNIDKIKECIIK